MILYHGSTGIIRTPLLIEPQRLLDFGAGFYTTSSEEQAEKWAIIKCKRAENEQVPIVNCYELDDTILHQSTELNIRIFEIADEEWLDFVISNRTSDRQHNFDIVKGPVANDTLFRTLTLFESGILTKQETISRLKTHILYDQLSFNSERSIDLLKYQSYYQLAI